MSVSILVGGGDDRNWLATHPEMGGKALIQQALGVSSSAIPCITKRWSITSWREGFFCGSVICYETVELCGDGMIFVLSGDMAEKGLSLAGYKVLAVH